MGKEQKEGIKLGVDFAWAGDRSSEHIFLQKNVLFEN